MSDFLPHFAFIKKSIIRFLPVFIIGLFLLALFGNPSKALAAQAVTVTVGNPNGGNIVGAYVSANGGMSGGCTTNSLGYCSINLPSPGNYTIAARYGSFVGSSVYRYIGAGQTLSIRLTLSYGDGTGGSGGTYNPPTPTTVPTTSVNVCIYRNGSPVSSGSVQPSWGGQSPVGSNGCRIYYVNKYQTIGFTAYNGGQSKYGTVYVGAVPTSLRIDMPASTVPPKISTSQAAPKRVEGSILTSSNTLYKQPVTVYLRNTNTGSVGSQPTSSGYYAFTGLAGGTQSYEVYATLPSGTRIPGGKTFNLTSGTMTVSFKVSGTTSITNPPSTQPKRIEVSILTANGSVYKNNAIITLKNTNTGQTNSQATSTGSYVFTGLAGGTQTYQVSAVANGQNLSGTQTFSLSFGTKKVEFRVPGNPGITITKPPPLPTNVPTKAPTTAGPKQISGTVSLKSSAGTRPLLQSVKITATNRSDQSKSVNTNASNGTYVITGLNAQYYDVEISIPSGYRATTAVTQPADFSNTSSRVINYTIESTGTQPTKSPTPIVATAKVNLTVKVQDVRGGPISNVQVGVDPDGKGYYYTNSSGIITASVDRNAVVSINASKDGFTPYKTSGINVGPTGGTRTITLQGDSTSSSYVRLTVNAVTSANDPNRPTATNPVPEASIFLRDSASDVLQSVNYDPNGSHTFLVASGKTYIVSALAPDYRPEIFSAPFTVGSSDLSKTLVLRKSNTQTTPTPNPESVNFKLTVLDLQYKPIPGAQVGIDPDGRGYYYTDAQGVISTTLKPNTNVTINISKNGYLPYTREWPVRDSDIPLTVRLNKDINAITPTQATPTPIVATAKVNLTVKVQDVRGGPISNVQVGVDPDGKGYYYTNSSGIITATVDRNAVVSINASKDGFTPYKTSGINVGPTGGTRTITLQGTSTTVPTSTPRTDQVNLTLEFFDGTIIKEVRVELRHYDRAGEGVKVLSTGSSGELVTPVYKNSRVLLNISKPGYKSRTDLIDIGTENVHKQWPLDKETVQNTPVPFEKTTYKVRVLDTEGSPIPDVRVGVDPDGSGYFYTNSAGEITTSVDKRGDISINVFKSGYKPYITTTNPLGVANATHVVTLEPSIDEQDNNDNNLGTLGAPPEEIAAIATSDVSLSLQGVSDAAALPPSELTRPVSLSFYDSNDELVETVEGNLTYNEETSTFEGEIPIPESVPEGEYVTKVTSPGYLTEESLSPITVAAGETIAIPEVELIAGDVDQDNELTILDYTQLIDCYSGIQEARNCDTEKIKTTDFTNDGLVNEFDYNLFIRNLLNRQSLQN